MIESQSKNSKNESNSVKFSIRQINTLIKICQASGVESFRYEGLSLKFSPNNPLVLRNTAMIGNRSKADSGDEDEAGDTSRQDDYMQNLMITDPLEYEKIMMSGAEEYDVKES